MAGSYDSFGSVPKETAVGGKRRERERRGKKKKEETSLRLRLM